MNKEKLITNIISHLENVLSNAKHAANEAHLAATDDQSVAETQYDTLAIESAYLAEGQSRRMAELEEAINTFKALTPQVFTEKSLITLGALVQLHEDQTTNHWFFIGPAAGGYRSNIADDNFTVITPQSPMGQALIGKYQDDDISIAIGDNALIDYIADVR